MKRELLITRTVTITQRIPVDEDHYPGMSSEGATQYELSQDKAEQLHEMMEALGNMKSDEIDFSVTVVDQETIDRADL